MQESQAIQTRQLDASAMRATLAIRLDRESGEAAPDVAYVGEVYGPVASDRTTLPARFRVPELRVGEEAIVVVVDPCFWSEQSPLEYEIVLTPKDERCKTLRRTIRLRPRSELNG